MERRVRRVLLALAFGVLPLAARDSLPGSRIVHAQDLATEHCVFDRMTLWTPAGQCRPQARHFPRSVVGAARRSIYDSALIFGVPYKVLLKIARCESDLNPSASNGSHFGLFQFASATFSLAAERMRVETGIQAQSPWNPLDSSYAAGYMFATGQSPQWSCEPAH